MDATDDHGNALSTDAPTAALWREFCVRFQRQRSGVSEALGSVIASDQNFGVAHATARLLTESMGVPGLQGSDEVEAARTGTAEHSWERSYIDAALAAADAGPLWASVDRWFAHHDSFPTDVNGLLFGLFGATTSADESRRDQLRGRIERTYAEVGDDPVLLGFRAMGAQERGELDDAERFAARALDLDPTGSAGAHPMAHVHFERGDHRVGAAWLDDWLTTADEAAEFTTHLHWHAALHHLALGDTGEVLATYRDRLCRPEPRSMVDRTSMLWRLQLHGVVDPAVDPGATEYPKPLRDNVDVVPVSFFAVHVALGLAASGDGDSLRRLAATANDSTTPGAAKFVSPIALALAEHIDGDFGATAARLLPLADELALVGGSHAQREVLEDTLIDSLIRSGRHEEASARLLERLDRRPSTVDRRWLAACDATLAQPRQRE